MNHRQSFPATYEGLLMLARRLRGPEGCPWDRVQTHRSLTKDLLEECYELIDAIEQGDTEEMLEELGDVLFNLVLQVQIAVEAEEFTSDRLFALVIDKLMRRHRHVFSDCKVDDAREVEVRWEVARSNEKRKDTDSILDGVPKQMPALSYAQTIQGRASRVGFDWGEFQGVLEKVGEELKEMEESPHGIEKAQEVGDLLFSVVNAVRWLDVDAEGSLRQSNMRFFRRFTDMEWLSRRRGLSFPDLPMHHKEALWQDAKQMEAERHNNFAGGIE